MSFLVGCGNCIYYALVEIFPPTESWVVILPLWFIALAGIRTFTGARLSGIPSLYLAVPLALAVFVLAPALVGPPLGFWIPACCLVGTSSGRQVSQQQTVRRLVTGLGVAAAVCLLSCGAYNYYQA